jgi:hypothetical protein
VPRINLALESTTQKKEQVMKQQVANMEKMIVNLALNNSMTKTMQTVP